MSKKSSSDSIYTPATYSSGPSRIDYEQLFALFSKGTKDPESDYWAPYVEEALRQPQLGSVTFEFTYKDEQSEEWRWDALSNNEEQPSWEFLARVLMLLLQQAGKCWLHPSSHAGPPVLVEHHSGTVNRIVSERVSVSYGKGNNRFEVEYALSDIQNPEAISRGDHIEALIGLWHQKHQTRGIDHFMTQEEQQRLDADWDSEKNLVSGDLNL